MWCPNALGRQRVLIFRRVYASRWLRLSSRSSIPFHRQCFSHKFKGTGVGYEVALSSHGAYRFGQRSIQV